MDQATGDQQPTQVKVTYVNGQTPDDKPCLHCKTNLAPQPYVYCRACTDDAHRTAHQAAMRNLLTKPLIKVYRWDTITKKWVPKENPDVPI